MILPLPFFVNFQFSISIKRKGNQTNSLTYQLKRLFILQSFTQFFRFFALSCISNTFREQIKFVEKIHFSFHPCFCLSRHFQLCKINHLTHRERLILENKYIFCTAAKCTFHFNFKNVLSFALTPTS